MRPWEERAATSSSGNSNTRASKRESKNAARKKTAATRKKEKIIAKVLGVVKWHNVKRNYGFITRCDNQQDIFVHRTAIKKNNPEKCIPSLGDGEVVEFKIVRSRKGLQALQVTGPDGVPVKGSIYAKNRSHVRQYLHCKSPLQSPNFFPPPFHPPLGIGKGFLGKQLAKAWFCEGNHG
uniref:Uncharacterized protein n=1 Tax=Corvus moneduloides TaxID=1196302 RepID=A0A8U7N7Y0_CORMO